MKKRILIYVMGILVLALALFIFSFMRDFVDAKDSEENLLQCDSDEVCDDLNNCTIDTCRENFCFNTDVILCYQNDGCCPKGCNSENDNDCES